jgi:sec-independent protein translocase protein TatA
MVGDIFQPTHLLFVLVVALLVLGPKRLPEVARQLGNGLRDFRSAISGEGHHAPDTSDQVLAHPDDASVDEHPDMSVFHDDPAQIDDPGADVAHGEIGEIGETSDHSDHSDHADTAAGDTPAASASTPAATTQPVAPAAQPVAPAATAQPVAPTDKPA